MKRCRHKIAARFRGKPEKVTPGRTFGAAKTQVSFSEALPEQTEPCGCLSVFTMIAKFAEPSVGLGSL